ncbi:MAG: hypothetical protein ACI9K4_001736 [Polaribacter sp.]|jgi:hypothetical protein
MAVVTVLKGLYLQTKHLPFASFILLAQRLHSFRVLADFLSGLFAKS